MKRETAIHHALVVAQRLRDVTGIIATPAAGRPYVRVRRAWLFGSTVMRKERPNDVDILLDIVAVGDFRRPGCGGACLDKRQLRRYGVHLPRNACEEAMRWLRGGLRMVRLHDFQIDGEIATPRVMIYPRNGLCASGILESNWKRAPANPENARNPLS